MSEEQEGEYYQLTEKGIALVLAAEGFINNGMSFEEAAQEVGLKPMNLRIAMVLAGNITLSDLEE